jgi:hypothetical protein
MKTKLQYLVKLLFVVILPVVAVVTSIKLYIDLELTVPVVVAMVILIFGSFTNAIFFSSYMTKIKLMPKITYEFMPIIGFALGYDSQVRCIVMVIPFCGIEISLKKK